MTKSDSPRNASDASASGKTSGEALVACRREIEALHRFFEGWLSGRRPDTDAPFRRLDRALAPAFRLIDPSGDERSREDILTGLRRAHGSQSGLVIEIRIVQIREADVDLEEGQIHVRNREDEDVQGDGSRRQTEGAGPPQLPQPPALVRRMACQQGRLGADHSGNLTTRLHADDAELFTRCVERRRGGNERNFWRAID